MQPLVQFLAVCPSGAPIHWPEPLGTFVSHQRAFVEVHPTLHDIAARLVQTPDTTFHAILVSPRTMTLRHIPLLDTIARHKSLSIWLLPTASQIDPTLQEALEKRARKWQEAASQLTQLLQKRSTQDAGEGNSRIPMNSETPVNASLSAHLPGADSTQSAVLPQSAQTAVTPPAVGGYDGSIAPRLSDLELRVLLGAETPES